MSQEVEPYWAKDVPGSAPIKFASRRTYRLRVKELEAQVASLRAALTELRDAVKLEPAMNNMKYDDLGRRVNLALSAPPAAARKETGNG